MAAASFDRATLQFLRDLAAHNERDWFTAHKHRYDEHVVAPALTFIEAFANPLHRISRHFVAIPKRMGGSLMRVYRDTRCGRGAETGTPFTDISDSAANS